MDSLLASYGSDDDDDNEEGRVQASEETAASLPAPSAASELPRKVTLFGRLPPPKNSDGGTSAVSEIAGAGKPPLQHSGGGGAKRPGSLFGSLPPPQFAGSNEAASSVSSSIADLPEGTTERLSPVSSFIGDREVQNATSALPPRGSLFAKLPPPKLEPGTAHENAKEEETSVSRPTLFVALPPPKIEAGGGNATVKLEVSSSGGRSLLRGLPPRRNTPGIDNPKSKKQTVAFRPPVDMSVLDDDDWQPLKKKAKPEASATKGPGGGLSALLPAPKNSLGVGASLGTGATPGGRRAAMETVATAPGQDVKLEVKPEVVNTRIHTAAGAAINSQSEASVFDGVTQYSNAAYALDQSAASAPQLQYTNEPYGWAAPQGAYAPAQENSQAAHHHVSSQYEELQSWQYPGNVAAYTTQPGQASYAAADRGMAAEDPIAQVLQAERRRGREDRMAAPTVVEVKQSDLTGPKMTEDKLRTTGIAFGPSYQPVSSSKDKVSKLHRRKHQIGSLLHDMKAREMELLERRSKGSLTKAETQAKYGW